MGKKMSDYHNERMANAPEYRAEHETLEEESALDGAMIKAVPAPDSLKNNLPNGWTFHNLPSPSSKAASP